MVPTALKGTSPKSESGFRGGPVGIEKELDGALVRAERLRACSDSFSDVGRSILKNAFEGKL
jgi:hypothetical protein